MMSSSPISVWFACNICRHSFQNIDNFMRHKKDVHFDEFQKIKCIVFEERSFEKEKIVELAPCSKDKPKTEIGRSLLSVLMKKESQAQDQFNAFNYDDMLQSDADADLEPEAETETDTSINNTSNFSVACSSCTLGVEKQAIQENEVHSTLQETQPASENYNSATTDLVELDVDINVSAVIDPPDRDPDPDPDPDLHPIPVGPVAPTLQRTDAFVHLTRLTFNELKTAVGTGQSTDFALTLRHWLINQGSKSLIFSKKNESFHTNLNSPSKANFILLDPNPISENVGPITVNNPISCKLCSKILESEWEVKTHAKQCWLYNKINHSYCISCDQTFETPGDFRRHAQNHTAAGQVPSKLIHQKLKLGTGRKTEDNISSSKIFKAQADTFATRKNLTKNRVVFRCPFCSITFHRQSVLITHLKSHRNVYVQNKKGPKFEFYSRIPSYSPKSKQQCSRS